MSSAQVAIKSLVKSDSPYVGITNQGQSYVPVQLNPVDNVWTMTPQDNFDDYLFTIGSLFYTGAQGVVTASNDNTQSVTWHTTYQSQCDGYTIEVANSNPLVGWSVSDPSNPNSPIVVAPLDTTECNLYELFSIH